MVTKGNQQWGSIKVEGWGPKEMVGYILLWGSRKLGVMQTLAKRKNAPSFTFFFY
jgi:hypothetical protein